MENYNFPISWIPLSDNTPLCIGVSHCPGKLKPKKGSNTQLLVDLESLRRQNISSIVTLVTEHEISLLGIDGFNENVQKYNFEHYMNFHYTIL